MGSMMWQLAHDVIFTILAISAVVWVYLLWMFWSEGRAAKRRQERRLRAEAKARGTHP